MAEICSWLFKHSRKRFSRPLIHEGSTKLLEDAQAGLLEARFDRQIDCETLGAAIKLAERRRHGWQMLEYYIKRCVSIKASAPALCKTTQFIAVPHNNLRILLLRQHRLYS